MGLDADADAPLVSAGLDSLGAVELRDKLCSSLAVDLPGTLLFDHPSVNDITAHVMGLSNVSTEPECACLKCVAGRTIAHDQSLTVKSLVAAEVTMMGIDA